MLYFFHFSFSFIHCFYSFIIYSFRLCFILFLIILFLDTFLFFSFLHSVILLSFFHPFIDSTQTFSLYLALCLFSLLYLSICFYSFIFFPEISFSSLFSSKFSKFIYVFFVDIFHFHSFLSVIHSFQLFALDLFFSFVQSFFWPDSVSVFSNVFYSFFYFPVRSQHLIFPFHSLHWHLFPISKVGLIAIIQKPFFLQTNFFFLLFRSYFILFSVPSFRFFLLFRFTIPTINMAVRPLKQH